MDIFTDLKVAVCGTAQFYKYVKQFHLETFYNSRTRVTNVTTLNYHKPSIDAFRFSVIVIFATSVGGHKRFDRLYKTLRHALFISNRKENAHPLVSIFIVNDLPNIEKNFQNHHFTKYCLVVLILLVTQGWFHPVTLAWNFHWFKLWKQNENVQSRNLGRHLLG